MFAPIPPTELTKKQRSTLESWVRSPTKQSRAVQRAGIVLAAADGVSNRQILEGTLARYPARLQYTVDEHDGGTRLTNTVDLELTGAARLLGGVAVPRIRSAVAENLEVLKRLLESVS